MCYEINVGIDAEGFEIQSVRQFQDYFKVDATKYGYEDGEAGLDQCLCHIELEQFFADNPQYKAEQDCGDWYMDYKKAIN